MHRKRDLFLTLLFDASQQTCFTSSPRGTEVRKPRESDEFFCINALDPLHDHAPTEVYHDVARPRRADANVVCFRNFLIELDGQTIEQQRALVCSRIPVSSIVYSGGKSLHFIVSLVHPLKNIEEYRILADRLLALLPEADPACRNPSRLSRLPFSMRRDTQKMQDLLHLGTRVENESLLTVLPAKLQVSRAQSSEPGRLSADILEATYYPDKVRARMGLAGRNQFFFWLGQRMHDLGFSLDQKRDLVDKAYRNLESASGFPASEAYLAARVK